PPFPPELKILSRGALLATSGERKVAILARDVPGIRVAVGRVLPTQLQHLVSQSEGDFTNPQFYQLFGADNLVERFERKVTLPRGPRGRAHYHAVDLSEYLTKEGGERRGVFLLSVSVYDAEREKKEKARAQRNARVRAGEDAPDDGSADEVDESRHQVMDRRLVLITDLGLLAKKSVDGSQDVFVQSIHSGAPVAGATVEVVAKNGVAVLTRTTDAGGRAQFPRFEGLTRERAPLMYVVRKGGDTSFLPLNRRDRMLDVSRFDVGGVQNARVVDELGAYLFSDRGIYRPGDTIHVGVIVKSAGWARSVAGLPLEAEIYDPRGLVVKKEKVTLGATGFAELTHTTLETSPTGVYPVTLWIVKDGRLDQQIGSTTVRVQEFLPDRMRVTAHLTREAPDGWVSPTGLKAHVSVQNLFGTPGEQRRVEATLTLSPAFPVFARYRDYHFFDPQRAKEGYSDTLSPVTTNERGEAELNLKLERYAKATYRVHVLARAFEPESGRGVAAETSALVSELPFLVGYKPDGPLDYVSRATARTVTLIAIDPAAKATAVEGLTLDRIERTFVSVLTRQPNGTFRYESHKKEISLEQTSLAIPAAGMKLSLSTDQPGNFAYVVRDRDGLELNRVEYSVAGRGNVTRSLERNAELQLTLDKKQHDPGDEIEISIRAPYTGAGLVTIERDRVYAHQWFRSTTLASVQRIRVPRDFEGNGYVVVQFIRDPSSDEIFMSPLSYGVTPFAISLASRTNTVSLTVPELAKPGHSLSMNLVVGQPARAIVFAVDEGILQVARYQPPDPLDFFFKKRALEVRSAQILDLILPEFRKLMSAAAPGGDAEALLGRHLNPFKRKRERPVVYWSGLVDVAGQRQFQYSIPDYFNGSLRVFAVTVTERSIGVASARSTVRGDFVLSPNAPTAVTPDDEFDVSVGVANNVMGSGADASVTLSLTTPPQLEVLGGATQPLKIGEGREGVATFRMKAREGAETRLGSATLRFTASLGAQSATLGADISIRPATPHATVVTSGSFTGSTDVRRERDLHAEYRRLEASVSAVPLVLASGLANYLADFEHLCSEQLVSQAVPVVVLATRPELSRTETPTSRTPSTLDDALRVLRTRQNAEGGFGLWTASVQSDEFVSIYAAHLLLEARERGQQVPPDMVQKSLAYLQQVGATPARDLPAARRRAYAAYLLTRQGIVTTPMLTSLREMLEARYPKDWTQDLVAVYLASSYQLLKQERLALKLIAEPLARLGKPDAGERESEYYDSLVRDMQTLYLVARHFPEGARRLPASTLVTMAAPLNRGSFSTLSAAYSILALDAYATTVASAATGTLSITEIAGDGKTRQLTLGPGRSASGTARHSRRSTRSRNRASTRSRRIGSTVRRTNRARSGRLAHELSGPVWKCFTSTSARTASQ
ncbi:MAG: alpha-2-macroglobulin, partial [Candidatus Rokuibacteriota bacterium]